MTTPQTPHPLLTTEPSTRVDNERNIWKWLLNFLVECG